MCSPKIFVQLQYDMKMKLFQEKIIGSHRQYQTSLIFVFHKSLANFFINKICGVGSVVTPNDFLTIFQHFSKDIPVVCSLWKSVEFILCNWYELGLSHFPDHSIFRENGVNTGLVKQTSLSLCKLANFDAL